MRYFSMTDTPDSIENVELPNKYAFCMACGDLIRHASVLICIECLGGECENFVKMVQASIDNQEE